MANTKSLSFLPSIKMAIISLLLCGLLFPVLMTGLAQILFPYQANGEMVQLGRRDVGSILTAQQFTSPIFFHPRNDSASGMDPHITLQDAYSQIPRISASTGIEQEALRRIVDSNVERTILIFGEPYVNVLRINLILIEKYPTTYQAYR
jgi:K+-transporting ATPase ATPase C chain